MRLGLYMLPLYLLLMRASLAPAQNSAGISAPPLTAMQGMITRTSGAPIRRATLELVRYKDPGAPVESTSGNTYTTQTDTNGNYIFEDVPPGRYTLLATRAGYLATMYGPQNANSLLAEIIEVEAGKRLANINIVMTPQGVVGGKVTDEFGDPVGPVSVQAFRRHYARGIWTLERAGAAAVAADSSYVIGGLQPGRYYLTATPIAAVKSSDDRIVARDKTSRARTTFYGNTFNASLAIPINMTAGMEMRSADIVMANAPGFDVSGRVEGFSSTAATNMLLMPADEFGRQLGGESYRQTVQPDGSFRIRAVAHGLYRAQTTLADGRNNAIAGSSIVEVVDSDIDGVIISPSPQTRITGGVFITNGQSQLPEIYLRTSLNGQTLTPMMAAENGSLSSPPLLAQTYQLDLSFGSSLNDYVKQVRLNGQPLTSNMLTLPPIAVSDLRIEISDKASLIGGTAKKVNGDPARITQVAVWPANPALRESFRIVRRADGYTGSNGEFIVGNLPPGDYRVAAFQDPSPGLLDLPEFLAQFDNQATAVTVQEGARANVTLTSIGFDAMEAAEARLP